MKHLLRKCPNCRACLVEGAWDAAGRPLYAYACVRCGEIRAVRRLRLTETLWQGTTDFRIPVPAGRAVRLGA